MKRNVCTKLTAVLLAAILIMPTQMIAHAEEYGAVDISPEMQTDIKDKFLWTEENELSEVTSVSDEAAGHLRPEWSQGSLWQHFAGGPATRHLYRRREESYPLIKNIKINL